MKDSLMRLMQLGKQLEKVSNHNISGIEEKNSDEVLVVGVIFMKKGDLPMDQLEDIVEKEQVNPSEPSVAKVLEEAKKVTCFIYNHIWTVDLMTKYTQGKQILRPALTRFATHFIQLEEITRQKQDKHETFGTPQAQRAWRQMNPDVDPLLEWLQEKEIPFLYGEITGVLPVNTSDDETNVDESHQQNLAHSSSSAIPSQSGDGLDSGGLSPIDDDDDDDGGGGGGGRDEIRSKFGGNISPKARRDRSEPKAPSKGKCKKYTYVGSSSSRSSSSSNLGQGDSSTSTQGHENQVKKALKMKVKDLNLLVIPLIEGSETDDAELSDCTLMALRYHELEDQRKGGN
ncbi:hypothetical protein F3Y22_tig00001644pilonHSYRG00518 [Hibiscus syriacus]|uniref:Uncharacterized protein n=1 Tax=Hibiscus syriacus TaxID=106335 RepID=A0A6A3CXD4_HIBSY|nr:hypothetical protein F3Y22_tig00001644pilonHSYRG00518 [Hibiscus syriacus]